MNRPEQSPNETESSAIDTERVANQILEFLQEAEERHIDSRTVFPVSRGVDVQPAIERSAVVFLDQRGKGPKIYERWTGEKMPKWVKKGSSMIDKAVQPDELIGFTFDYSDPAQLTVSMAEYRGFGDFYYNTEKVKEIRNPELVTQEQADDLAKLVGKATKRMR